MQPLFFFFLLLKGSLQCRVTCGAKVVRVPLSATTGQDDIRIRAWALGLGCLHLSSGFLTSDKSLRSAVPQWSPLQHGDTKAPTSEGGRENSVNQYGNRAEHSYTSVVLRMQRAQLRAENSLSEPPPSLRPPLPVATRSSPTIILIRLPHLLSPPIFSYRQVILFCAPKEKA